MNLTPIQKKVLTASVSNPLRQMGVDPRTVVNTITAGLRESRETNYGWRRETSIFFDYSQWFGVSDRDVRNPLTRMNPSIREVIDFYMFPRLTTMGQFPFQTLFLESEWARYGINESIAKTLESEVKEGLGLFGYAMIIDTLNMIMTGTRDIPISLLVSYMDDGISNATTVVEERFCRKELRKMSTKQFLTKWLSTEKGMYDCIEIHRLVFNIQC